MGWFRGRRLSPPGQPRAPRCAAMWTRVCGGDRGKGSVEKDRVQGIEKEARGLCGRERRGAWCEGGSVCLYGAREVWGARECGRRASRGSRRSIPFGQPRAPRRVRRGRGCARRIETEVEDKRFCGGSLGSHGEEGRGGARKARRRARRRGCPNGCAGRRMRACPGGARAGEPLGLKHISKGRRRNQQRFPQ